MDFYGYDTELQRCQSCISFILLKPRVEIPEIKDVLFNLEECTDCGAHYVGGKVGEKHQRYQVWLCTDRTHEEPTVLDVRSFTDPQLWEGTKVPCSDNQTHQTIIAHYLECPLTDIISASSWPATPP